MVADFFGEGGGGGVEAPVLGVDPAERAMNFWLGDVEALESGGELGGEGEVGQQGDAEAGFHEGADGVEFAGFAGDLGFKAGAAAGVDGDVAGAAFVEDEGVIAEVHQADGIFATGHFFADKEIEGFADEAVDIELAVVGGELEEAEVGDAGGDGFGDAGGAVLQKGQFDVGIFGAVFLDDGREPAADEGGDGAEGEAAAFDFVYIDDVLLGLTGQVENQIGAVMKEFAGGCQTGAATVADEELRFEVAFQFLDLFAQGSLGEVKGAGGLGEVAMASDGEEVFELVEFHRKKR